MARRALYNCNGAAADNSAQSITANGSYTFKSGSGAASALNDWQGGSGMWFLSGTFDSASCTLQIQGPDGTWFNLGTAATAAGAAAFTAPAGPMRMTVASVVTASALKSYLVGTPTNNGG